MWETHAMIASSGPQHDAMTRRLLRALVVTGLALAVGGLLWMATAVIDRVHNTLVVVIFSILFAYVVYPPIKMLVRRGVPVALAGVIVYVVLGGLVLGAIAWLTPAVATQAADLSQNFPKIVAQVQREIADPTHAPLLQSLPANLRDAIAQNAGKAGVLVGGLAGALGANAVGIAGSATAAIINIFLVLGLTLLIVGDLEAIQSFGVRVVPPRYRRAAVSFMSDVDKVVGGFVRGQVLLALGVAVVGTLVLLAVGVPYAVLLGLLAGIVSIVPIVGPIVAILPIVVIAFFTVGLTKLIIVVVLYVVILGLQQNVFTPLVNSRSVGVTPLVVFVALLLGSEAFGILGALLSIPIAGIARVTAERLFPEPTGLATEEASG
jgi:predicted PurR-regulated permease PerM